MKTLFVLLSLSTFALGQTYTSTLTSDGVIKAGAAISTEPAIATATFKLTTVDGDPSATTLSYGLSLDAFDLDGSKTSDLGDDVTAIHLHTLNTCAAANCIAGDTAGTKHVLNIFGVPREDDADLVVDIANSTVSGVWDPSDVNSLTPAPGQDPNTYLSELTNGELFIMVHTREFSDGAVGGVLVPEPSSLALILIPSLCLLTYRRQRSARNRSI